MLKYLYIHEIFREVPDEITLGISISGCQIRCKGCHSRELWEDKGTVLSIPALERLINNHQGITCVCLFGGEHDIDTLKELFAYVKQKNLKSAWYCGLDWIPREHVDILKHLDYYKVGHFDMELGGLDSPTTNQQLYQISKDDEVGLIIEDITYKLQKNDNKSIRENGRMST